MGPNAESPNSRLSYLENIHAELVEKVSALARLRKQVQLKGGRSSRNDCLSKTTDKHAADLAGRCFTRSPAPLVKFSPPAMGPESLVGFFTILIYWRVSARSGPDKSLSPCSSWSRCSSWVFSAAIF